MNIKNTSKTKWLLLFLFSGIFWGNTLTAQHDPNIAPLQSYLGMRVKDLVKTFEANNLSLSRNKEFKYYKYKATHSKLPLNIYFHYSAGKKIHRITWAQYPYPVNESIKDYHVYLKRNKVLQTFPLVIRDRKNWHLKVAEGIQLICKNDDQLNNYTLIDCSSKNNTKCLAETAFETQRTDLSKFQYYERKVFFPPLTNETIVNCLTGNCDKEGVQSVQGQLINGMAFEGTFNSGKAYGLVKMVEEVEGGYISYLEANFEEGVANGEFKWIVAKEEDKTPVQVFKGTLSNGYLRAVDLSIQTPEKETLWGKWTFISPSSPEVDLDNYELEPDHHFPGELKLYFNHRPDYEGTGYLFPLTLHSFPGIGRYWEFSGEKKYLYGSYNYSYSKSEYDGIEKWRPRHQNQFVNNEIIGGTAYQTIVPEEIRAFQQSFINFRSKVPPLKIDPSFIAESIKMMSKHVENIDKHLYKFK